MKKKENVAEGKNKTHTDNDPKGYYDCPATCTNTVNIYGKLCGNACTKHNGHSGSHYCPTCGQF